MQRGRTLVFVVFYSSKAKSKAKAKAHTFSLFIPPLLMNFTHTPLSPPTKLHNFDLNFILIQSNHIMDIHHIAIPRFLNYIDEVLWVVLHSSGQSIHLWKIPSVEAGSTGGRAAPAVHPDKEKRDREKLS